MRKKHEQLRNWWRRIRTTRGFQDFLIFLVFVFISTLFWFIMALNDNVQRTLDVGVSINGVPDSVTFINQPPVNIHVTVRDKGTNLMRASAMREPMIEINFRDYAQNDVLTVGRTDFDALLKKTFGSSAQIIAVSVDSMRMVYTANPGKRVPIVVRADVTASSGNVIAGYPKLSQPYTIIYSNQDVLDTITRVYTQKIVKRNLMETTSFEVGLSPVAGARAIPDKVKATIPVEPMVNKHSKEDVQVINTPDGIRVILFPQKVEVSYYVPMSKFNSRQDGIVVVADFSRRGRGLSGKIPVRVLEKPSECVNVSLMADSLEYTIVK